MSEEVASESLPSYLRVSDRGGGADSARRRRGGRGAADSGLLRVDS